MTAPIRALLSRLRASFQQGVGKPQAFAPGQSILIVAELRIPQCAKYRVRQKQAYFARLGVPCHVVDWRQTADCLAAVASATQAILYRVPADPPVLALIDTLHARGIPTAWEVDDLIFDEAAIRQNSNLASLDAETQAGALTNARLYRTAMLACGAGIASTPAIGAAMREAGIDQVTVIENALDAETLALAAHFRSQRAARRHAGLVITYGSGSTHDADFAQAAPALLRLLALRPEARLRIIGELTLPEGFESFGDRVERLAFASFARYLGQLSESDIALAPLEPGAFNDAKSNIKFIEAACLAIPTICSPRAHFAGIVRQGRNGFLTEGEEAWLSALTTLAGSARLRRRIGKAALRTVLTHYDPDRIAWSEVVPLLRPPSTAPADSG
jgi:glycosyltransferase involved in cell wall biosynthesis